MFGLRYGIRRVRISGSHPVLFKTALTLILYLMVLPHCIYSFTDALIGNPIDNRGLEIFYNLGAMDEARGIVMQTNNLNLNLINISSPRHLHLYSVASSLHSGTKIFSGLLVSGITLNTSAIKADLENSSDLLSLEVESDFKVREQQYEIGWIQPLLKKRFLLGASFTPTITRSFTQFDSTASMYQGYNLSGSYFHGEKARLSVVFESGSSLVPFSFRILEFVADQSVLRANIKNMVIVNGALQQYVNRLQLKGNIEFSPLNGLDFRYSRIRSKPHPDTILSNDIILAGAQKDHFTLAGQFTVTSRLELEPGIEFYLADAHLDALYRRANGSYSSFIRNLEGSSISMALFTRNSYKFNTNHTFYLDLRYDKTNVSVPAAALMDPVKYTGISYGVTRMTGDAEISAKMIRGAYSWNYKRTQNHFSTAGSIYTMEGSAKFHNSWEGTRDTLFLHWERVALLKLSAETEFRCSEKISFLFNATQYIPRILTRKEDEESQALKPSFKKEESGDRIYGLLDAGVDFRFYF